MLAKAEFDDVTLAMSLPQEQREPILRAIETEYALEVYMQPISSS